MPEHEPPLSGLLPPAPSLAAAVEPSQDVHTAMALLGAALDELTETVRALRRAANDESVDFRARIRELEGRLARLEAGEPAPGAAPPVAPARRGRKRAGQKDAKRARREAGAVAENVSPADVAGAEEVRARIARQLRGEHRRRAGADD